MLRGVCVCVCVLTQSRLTLCSPIDCGPPGPSVRGLFQARILEQAAISLEKAMAPHSSTLAWKIPWTEEPAGPQSMGSLRVGHD